MSASVTPTTVEVNGFAYREIRIRSGISVGDCAGRAGISRTYLTRLELGDRVRVSPQVLKGPLDALQLADRRTILANPHSSPIEIAAATA
ncbi:helix-turn-helix transcriptional regulator [Actinocorallia longicatena]|uniref:Helix-turn-helix protein n=1 Tax=Actinocorallia longicatena TaxID=111803 RepID=A0ABP6Q9Z8_9ACTN